MNNNLRNFKAFNLVKSSYHACLELKIPRHLKDQLLRATSSAALNLAEGSARRGIEDKRKFYNIALASLREGQAVIILANLEGCDAEIILDQASACVYKLLQTFG
ncbi:MAG: four helix bundle protein [Oligoflexia bacterium]|nr:four helix bundle protein [Oligoflexia bacterium]